MRRETGPGESNARWVWLLLAMAAGWLAATAADTADADRERLTRLRAEIARHDDLYFRKAAPEITDAEYDALKRELRALEAALPGHAAAGAAPAVGDDRSGLFPTHRHRVPMLSLDKAYTEAELRTFHAATTRRLGGEPALVVEPKYDGLAVSAVYEQGRLRRLVTRGNGTEGDDVTANARLVAGLPATLRAVAPGGARHPLPDLVELRGEVYLSRAEFARINAARERDGEEPFAHPRNLAAGTLKSLDPDTAAARRLDIVFYGWGAWEGAAPAPASQQELHALVRAWGLPGVAPLRVTTGADELCAAVAEFGRARAAWPFPADGVVVKVDDAAARQQLGDGPDAPRWALAFKFQPAQAVARVRAIAIQIGRTGVLTPVAELDPVQLAGTTVARATLHNRDEIARRDVRVGDFVRLEKAGEIIPAIVGVELDRRPADAAPFVFPDRCPECRTAVAALPDSTAVRCPNHDCPAQVRRRIAHFASAQGVDIKGLGPATVAALVAAGKVGSAADLYRLTREDLLAVDGIGAKTADRLLGEIARSRRAELWRFVAALGIPQIGPANARQLAAAAGSLAEIETGGATLGTSARASLAGYFALPQNRALVAALAESVAAVPREAPSATGAAEGGR